MGWSLSVVHKCVLEIMLQLRRSTVTGTKLQNNGLHNFYFQHILSRRLNQWTRAVRRSEETEIFLRENLSGYKSLSISRHYKVIWRCGISGCETDLFSLNAVLMCTSSYTKGVLTRCHLYRNTAHHDICSGIVKNTGGRWLKIDVWGNEVTQPLEKFQFRFTIIKL